MDRMKLQEKALLVMLKYGEVAWQKGIGNKYILHSVPKKVDNSPRERVPQMEIKQGFD